MYASVAALSESVGVIVLANVTPVWRGVSSLNSGGADSGPHPLTSNNTARASSRLIWEGACCTLRRSGDAPGHRDNAAPRRTGSASPHGRAAAPPFVPP